MLKLRKNTHDVIENFYKILVDNLSLAGQSDFDNPLLVETTKATISAIITDPRGVVSCPYVPTPLSINAVLAVFGLLELKIGPQVNIIRVLNDFIYIGTTNEETLLQGNFGRKYNLSKVKEAATVQQQNFEGATGIIFKSNLYNASDEEEKGATEYVSELMGPLGHHPSVCFLVGTLCYKSGTMGDLDRAYQLFNIARQGILLGPTCHVLQALSIFWMAKLGDFDVIVPAEPHPEDVTKFIVNFVLEKLLSALAVADGVCACAPSAVEPSLKIDIQSAISYLYFTQKWNPQYLEKAKSHFAIALTLYQAHSFLPSRLFIRAAKALKINVADFNWEALNKIFAVEEEKWNSSSIHSHSSPEKFRIIKDLWPTFLSASMTVWDSGAPIVAAKSHCIFPNLASVQEVKKYWWYETVDIAARATFSNSIEICEVCGNKTEKKCKACKKVYYCSRDCQNNDWQVSHKIVCKMVR